MKRYQWKEMEQEQLNPRFGRKVIHGGNLTIARVELKQDCVVPEHSHVNEQITMVESGALRFSIDGGEQVLRAGDMMVIPPHLPHAVVALEDSVAVDVFAPARADWLRGEDAYLRG
jgi:quercetin dioxygenase-like cupin family protein